MVDITRLQAYLHHAAEKQYNAIPVPPFTVFIHPGDDLPYFNYAIPTEACAGPIENSLARLKTVFQEQNRQPRFEFIAEFAPDLPAQLSRAGFIEEARQWGMACTPQTFLPAPDVPGLEIIALTACATVTEAQAFLTLQNRGFDAASTEQATAANAEHFLRGLGDGAMLMARLNGEAVAAGLYTHPFDGLTELAGLATLEPFRGRGIATALTAAAVRHAFAHGVETVYLCAADERAGRVYRRVGFAPCATVLAYS